MRSVSVAGTNLISSRLGFGLSSVHHLFRSRDRQDLLTCALHHGINYFDTSPYYGHGIAERELGRFAARNRNQIVIATKFGIHADPWLRRLPLLMYSRLAANAALRRVGRRETRLVGPRHDYSCRSAVASLENSLRALRTDHVDILFLHDPTLEQLADAEILFNVLRDLQSSGKVRHFGLAGNAPECLAILREHAGTDCLLQVNAARGREELQLLRDACIPFQTTFGHFRGHREPLNTAMADAIAANAHGVILFSTRRAHRIRSMVELVGRLENS